jgi:chromosome segregation ATPase
LTSSNETSRNSRINIYIASVLCVLVLAAVVLLFMVVRSLDAEFGDVRRNLPSMEREITTLGERRDQLASTVTGLEDRQLALQGSVADLAPLTERVDGLRANVVDLESRKSAAEIRLRELGGIEAKISTASDSQANLQRGIASLETQRIGLADEVSNLGGNRNQLSDEVDALRSQRDALQTDERRLRSEVAGLSQQRAEVSALTEQAANLNATVDELTPRAQEAAERLAALRAQIVAEQSIFDGLSSEVSALRSIEAVLQAANAELEERNQSLDAQIATAQTQLKASQTGLASSESAASEIEARLRTLRADSTKAASALALVEQDRAAKRVEIVAAQNILAELNAEIAARGIVRSALAEAEQSLADIEGSLVAKSAESTALAESLAQGRADLTLARRDLQSASEELALAQNRLAELNAEIAARGIVRSALAEAEQSLADIEGSLAAKSAESTALAESLAQGRADLTLVRRDLQSASEELLSVQAELALAQNRLAELNAEIAARGIVRSALFDAEQRLVSVATSVATKLNESSALTESLAGLRAELTTSIAELEISRSQLAKVSAQRTNAEIKRDEAIRTMQTAERSASELSQSIELQTQKFDRLQVDLAKARADLAIENEALENARVVLEGSTSEPVANPAQTDSRKTAEDVISPEPVQKDADTVDPARGGAVAPIVTVPADGDSVQEQPIVADQGEGN